MRPEIPANPAVAPQQFASDSNLQHGAAASFVTTALHVNGEHREHGPARHQEEGPDAEKHPSDVFDGVPFSSYRTRPQQTEDMPVATDKVEGALETGFRRDDEGIYVECRQVKACLRESAQRLGMIKKVQGFRQVVQHDLHVRAENGSQKLRLRRQGDVVEEPDGKDMRPISVLTRQGPRTAIKRFEYATEPVVEFEVKVLAGGIGDGKLDEAKLREMLEFGGMLGLGADRSQGEGTFVVESSR